jgi:hypothetical protein
MSAPTRDGGLADGLTGGQATALAWLVDSVPADPAQNVTGWGLWRDLLTRLDALFGHARQARLPG